MKVQWLFECLIDKKGGWNDTGCETVKSNATHTSCSCDHLTHFGVLLVSSVLFVQDIDSQSIFIKYTKFYITFLVV